MTTRADFNRARKIYEATVEAGDPDATELARRRLRRIAKAYIRSTLTTYKWCNYHADLHPPEDFYLGKQIECREQRHDRYLGVRKPRYVLGRPPVQPPGRKCKECGGKFTPMKKGDDKCEAHTTRRKRAKG